MIEHMFENFTDAALIDAVGEATRDESAAVARRYAAIGALDARRAEELAECNWWRTDPHEQVTAEISAAQNISRGRASTQVHYARVLRDRLPQVASVFATGAIDERMVCIIIARTENVDAEVIERLDAALARHCGKWMRLSGPKLHDRIDLWVAKFDPAGVRIAPKARDNRYVDIGPTSPGIAGIWASVHATDAAALDTRLDERAGTVCENDPRTAAQRRAVGDAVIHVLAEQATIDGTGDHPGYLQGFGILPAESVRELAATAKLKALAMPSGTPDPGYRPSKATAEFARWRDMTCRAPGCDAPVERCDIDHTQPYPAGATHPSNNKLYCRTQRVHKQL